MPFAIVIYFDRKTEETIHNNWKAFADKNIDPYLYKSENRPHIKLGMYERVHIDKCRDRLKEFSQNNRVMNILFKNIGIFPLEKPIVYLGAASSKQILETQIEINNGMKDIAREKNGEYFIPGGWTPDCQLTVGVEKRVLAEAINIASEIPIPMRGKITEIGLIEFFPAKKLFEYKLKK